jgi:hypothetical protein
MSRFYTAPDQVLDGDVAYARDVNRINNEADAAFTAVAAEIDAQEATLQSYVDKASLWANEVEDVEVEPGKYSALHFAAKSEDFSIASAGSASSSSNSASAAQAAQGLAESARDGAQLAETNAKAAELKASKWSDGAENVEVEPGRYSASHWSQKAAEYASSAAPPSDEVYSISWNGSSGAATKNALYDKFELVASAISAKVSTADIDDTPVSGATTAPISSNWAYIHNAASNPHGTTKADVGLGSVDNTSDLGKPISSATQTALDSKEPSLGAPAMDGYVLSSTTAGVRSWVEVPKSGLQTVPGLDTTGNIMGFNLSKTGANQVTVSKGSCLDSTLTVPLALTADTAVAIPSVANTIYHVFVVRLVADGSMTVKTYTSEAGVASDSTVDKWRWVGFCVTDGSAGVYGFEHTENVITFDGAGITFQSSIGAQTAVSSTTSFIPSTRIEDITVCAIASSSSSFTWGYVGLLNNGVWIGIAYTPSRGRGTLIGPLHLATLESCAVECLVEAGTPSGSLHISTVTIKR